MKAIRKRVKPPPLSTILKNEQNDSDASTQSTESSNISSPPNTLPTKAKEWRDEANNNSNGEAAVEAAEKKQQKTRVFEKRRSQNHPSCGRQKTDISAVNSRQSVLAQDLNAPSASSKPDPGINCNQLDEFELDSASSFQLRVFNPRSDYQSAVSLSSEPSVTSTTTKSTLLSQIQLTSAIGSQLSLISKLMEDLEKNNKGSELYPALPKANNRRIAEPLDEKSIAIYAGLTALCVLSFIILGIAAFMYFSM